MSTITNVINGETGLLCRGNINDNDNNLNADKVEKVDADYTASGTDESLTSPEDTFNSIANFIPIVDESLASSGISVGSEAWSVSSSAGATTIFNGDGNAGPTYGVVRFDISISGGINWGAVANSSTNGLKTFTFPQLANGDSLGGSVQYYFDSAAWTTAFLPNTDDVVISQSGNVYKGSIATGNLVVDINGVVGPAGFAGIIGPASSTDNALVKFDATTGKLAQNTAAILDDTGNLTGLHGTAINHTATEADDFASEIIVNAAGFTDVKAVDIAYITGALAASDEEEAVLVNIDKSLSTGGRIVGYEVIATGEGSAEVDGLEIGAGVHPIKQISGTFANLASILNIAVDVLVALSSGGAGNISAFVADNDTMTFGLATKFEELEYILDTVASGSGIAPTFEFSTGVGTWAAFGPTDGTNGMRNSGVVTWLTTDIPSWAVGTGSEFLIRITRTRNSLSTTPILDLVQAETGVIYDWDKDGNVNVKSITGLNDITIPQAVHTLNQGDPIYNNAGTWTLAKSDVAGTVARYIVTENVDTNTFKMAKEGLMEWIAHGLTLNVDYYVSDSVAGDLTSTEPSNPSYSNPVLMPVDTNTVLINVERSIQALF